MIAYIKGTLEHCLDSHVIVETAGIGYTITISAATMASLPAVGEKVKIFTHMNVKEDGVSLYGFSSLEELDLFHKLITVSGVGPKGALGFLAVMRPKDIILAILSADEKALGRAPGVGKKTAQRVILELRDKFNTVDALSGGISFVSENVSIQPDAKLEAVEALQSLGYSRTEAATAVAGVFEEGMDTEALLKKALTGFSKL